MLLKYNLNISEQTINKTFKRLTNQIYKLLPTREQNQDWIKPLETIIQQIAGMSSIMETEQVMLFSLVCKLQGLKMLKDQSQFLLFRRMIFQCLRMLGELQKQCQV